ncbi:nucleoside hydrolase [Elioraea sp.]|uniref:nucleoside hydrolase n=1 Tax=Elioraea sp. TaxID=2185103 RepID=UPI0025B972CB|nr:nucleoside hydrolase [Elioraea sp.]
MPEQLPLLIDCDPGADDAVALLMAAAAPSLALRLVTTVGGNAPIDVCTANARRVLDLAGRGDVPVQRGAAGPRGGAPIPDAVVHGTDGLAGLALPPPSRGPDGVDAVAALAAAMPMTVAAIGPLTNIAALIDRGVVPADLVVLGGAIGPGNTPSGAEYNLAVDPEAARLVLAHPVRLVPLDIAGMALATPARIAAIAASSRIGARIAPMLAAYAEADGVKHGRPGGMLPDAHAIAALIDPGLYTWRRASIAVDGMGRTRFDWAEDGRGGEASVATAVDEDGLFALLAGTLAAL